MKTSQLKRRRVRAILAGGAVLGVGAVVTMAAWSDSEFVSGVFASGTFDLVGSTNGTEFIDHADSSSAAGLSFTMNPENLSPGDVITAPFSVALKEGTSYGADVLLTSASMANELTGVTYGILQTTGFGCDDLTGATSLVPAGTALGSTLENVTFPVAAPTDTVRSQINLCFTVTATDELNQGARTNAIWEFAAQSRS